MNTSKIIEWNGEFIGAAIMLPETAGLAVRVRQPAGRRRERLHGGDAGRDAGGKPRRAFLGGARGRASGSLTS